MRSQLQIQKREVCGDNKVPGVGASLQVLSIGAIGRYIGPIGRRLLMIPIIIALGGCGFLSQKNAYWNQPSSTAVSSTAGIRYQTPNRPGSREDTLFILASSGGGSRAAVFTSLVMLELESQGNGVNLLDEVDAISSVSGGSVPVAYYAISKSKDPSSCGSGKKKPNSRPSWDDRTVLKKMSSNFQGSWLLRWFLPHNAVRFWFTSFDRSDIMAQVFAKKLGKYTYGDICDDKPRIFINATRATYDGLRETRKRQNAIGTDRPILCPPEAEREVGGVFTFSDCEFDNLSSSLEDYPIANAVVASSAFPAVFNYTTLRDFTKSDDEKLKYLHLYDGGSRDNLGLSTVTQVIDASHEQYEKIVVILVDAYLEPQGVSSDLPDARIGVDFVVDSNFLDSIDILLSTNRRKTIDDFRGMLAAMTRTQGVDTFFYHLSFSDLDDNSGIHDEINDIKTRFKIIKPDLAAIRQATDELFANDGGRCLAALNKMLAGDPVEGVLPSSTDTEPCELNTLAR